MTEYRTLLLLHFHSPEWRDMSCGENAVHAAQWIGQKFPEWCFLSCRMFVCRVSQSGPQCRAPARPSRFDCSSANRSSASSCSSHPTHVPSYPPLPPRQEVHSHGSADREAVAGAPRSRGLTRSAHDVTGHGLTIGACQAGERALRFGASGA